MECKAELCVRVCGMLSVCQHITPAHPPAMKASKTTMSSGDDGPQRKTGESSFVGFFLFLGRVGRGGKTRQLTFLVHIVKVG